MRRHGQSPVKIQVLGTFLKNLNHYFAKTQIYQNLNFIGCCIKKLQVYLFLAKRAEKKVQLKKYDVT